MVEGGFLRPYSKLIGGIFGLSGGFRFSFWAPEVLELRVRKRPLSLTKMVTFRILVLVSKTEIRSKEFSISSRSLRMKIINLDLVSMPEIGGDFFSVSSQSLRLSVRNSRSRLDVRD